MADQFSNYNGEQVRTDPAYWSQLQSTLDQRNQDRGQNWTLQQYDQYLNPDTAGARWDQAPMPSKNTSSGGGMSQMGPSLNAYTPSPYLAQQASALSAQSNQNLNQNVFPQIANGALASGGFGDTRQGIAQGLAAGNAQTGLNSQIANLYGQDYQAQMGRNLQQYQGDQQFSLGLGNLGNQGQSIANNYNLGLGQLGNQATAQNNSFYTQNRQLDQSGAALGSSLFGSGAAGVNGIGSGLSGLGGVQQSAEWSPYANYTNIISPYTGYGASNVSSQSSSPIGAALGGAGLGNNIYNSYQKQNNGGYSGSTGYTGTADPLGDFIAQRGF